MFLQTPLFLNKKEWMELLSHANGGKVEFVQGQQQLLPSLNVLHCVGGARALNRRLQAGATTGTPKIDS